MFPRLVVRREAHSAAPRHLCARPEHAARLSAKAKRDAPGKQEDRPVYIHDIGVNYSIIDRRGVLLWRPLINMPIIGDPFCHSSTTNTTGVSYYYYYHIAIQGSQGHMVGGHAEGDRYIERPPVYL